MGCLTQGGNQWDGHHTNYCRSLSINSSALFSQDLRFRYPVAASNCMVNYFLLTLDFVNVLGS